MIVRQDDVAAARAFYTKVLGMRGAVEYKFAVRRGAVLGDFSVSEVVSYGGMLFDEAERSMRPFVKKVMPRAAALESPSCARGGDYRRGREYLNAQALRVDRQPANPIPWVAATIALRTHADPRSADR